MCEEACLTIGSFIINSNYFPPQDGVVIEVHLTHITIKLFNIRMVHRGLRNVKIEVPYSAPKQAFEGICFITTNTVKLWNH
jgi:hypothetical protein